MDRYRNVLFFDPAAQAKPRSWPVLTRRREPQAAAAEQESPLNAELADFFAWLFAQAGLNAEDYRPTSLNRRLTACLRGLRVASVTEARSLLERRPGTVADAIRSLLLGVTEFFRDPAVFSHINDAVLPRLAAGEGALRIWSAGCSDGAELYSLAMLLERRSLLSRSRLVGTDCRADAVARASLGVYDAALVCPLDGATIEEFFSRQKGRFRIREPLRGAIRWQVANLLCDFPADEDRWNMILCRNVAIYLRPRAASSLWTRLAERLVPGGILIAGKAERPDHHAPFRRLGNCTFEKES